MHTLSLKLVKTPKGTMIRENLIGLDSVRQQHVVKPIFHLATLFVRREAKTRVRQRDWLKLAGEKFRREQVGSVPTLLSVCANKFAK